MVNSVLLFRALQTSLAVNKTHSDKPHSLSLRPTQLNVSCYYLTYSIWTLSKTSLGKNYFRTQLHLLKHTQLFLRDNSVKLFKISSCIRYTQTNNQQFFTAFGNTLGYCPNTGTNEYHHINILKTTLK